MNEPESRNKNGEALAQRVREAMYARDRAAQMLGIGVAEIAANTSEVPGGRVSGGDVGRCAHAV